MRSFVADDVSVTWWRLGGFDYAETTDRLNDFLFDWLISSRRIDTLGDFEMQNVSAASIARLNTLGHVFQPTRLVLPAIGQRSWRALLASRLTEKVADLDVPVLVEEGAVVCTRKVKKLSGRVNRVAADLAEIANSPALSELEELDIRCNDAIGQFGLAPMYDPPALRRLRSLRVSARVDADEACALLKSPLASQLEELSLKRTPELEVLARESTWDGVLTIA